MVFDQVDATGFQCGEDLCVHRSGVDHLRLQVMVVEHVVDCVEIGGECDLAVVHQRVGRIGVALGEGAALGNHGTIGDAFHVGHVIHVYVAIGTNRCREDASVVLTERRNLGHFCTLLQAGKCQYFGRFARGIARHISLGAVGSLNATYDVGRGAFGDGVTLGTG